MPEVRYLRIYDGLQLKSGGHGRAGGKAILVGEHFVLHGSRAIAIPVGGRHVEVSLAPTEQGRFEYAGPEEGRVLTTAMCAELGVQSGHVAVGGSLPLSAGLGSSAALATALVRATGVSEPAEVQVLAHRLEQLAHGRASGIDDAVISHDQAVLFDPSATGENRFRWLDCRPPSAWIAWVPRVKSTREAVAGVARLQAENPDLFQGVAVEVAGAVEPMLADLHAGDERRLGARLGPLQRALEWIGVVVDDHRRIIDLAMTAGAYGAKTTGAGWGGAVLMLGPRELDLDRQLAEHGVSQCFFSETP